MIPLVCDQSCSSSSGIFIHWDQDLLIHGVSPAGPDAVKYIVNHASIQAIFCVPQTLNTVSLSHKKS